VKDKFLPKIKFIGKKVKNMFRWLVVYGDGSSDEKWADTLEDALFQSINNWLIHSIIKLGIIENK